MKLSSKLNILAGIGLVFQLLTFIIEGGIGLILNLLFLEIVLFSSLFSFKFAKQDDLK